jgi:hypothetical protein
LALIFASHDIVDQIKFAAHHRVLCWNLVNQVLRHCAGHFWVVTGVAHWQVQHFYVKLQGHFADVLVEFVLLDFEFVVILVIHGIFIVKIYEFILGLSNNGLARCFQLISKVNKLFC